MGRTLQLYQLQSLDSDIDETNKKLTEITTQLGESDALKQAKAAHDTAATELRKSQTKMQDLDLELKSLTDKISREEKLLYSGRAISAKEAANLQEEVASLKRRQEDREEHLLEAMVEVETAEETFATAQTTLSEVETNWKEDQADLLQAQTENSAKLVELKKRRPAVAGGVDANDQALYEKLRKKKNGYAVALIKNGVCQRCGMTSSNSKIQLSRTETELTYCGVCGRILYAP